MPDREVLLLGDPRWYEVRDPVKRSELSQLQTVVDKRSFALRGQHS